MKLMMSNQSWQEICSRAALTAACSLVWIASAGAAVNLTGAVSTRDGSMLDGVTVSARAETSGITTSVYTDAQGKYTFRELPPGRYQLWAQAVGYARTRQVIELPAKQAPTLKLEALTDQEQLLRQLPTDVLLRALPQSTAADKDMVRLLRSTCSDCHTPGYVLQQKFDVKGWQAVIELMSRITISGNYRGDDATPLPDIWANREQLAQYLARVRGPGASELKVPATSRPSGEAIAVVYREYPIPLESQLGLPADFPGNDGTNWSEGMPSQLIPGHQPHDAVADLQGNLWFTNPVPSNDATFGRIDGKTGAVRLFKLPGHGGFSATTHGIVRDPVGNIWTGASTEHGTLAKIDPKTQTLKIYQPPVATGASVSLDSSPDGKIWMSSVGGALSFDPAHDAFAHYSVGTSNNKGNYDPTFSYGVAGDRNGHGWWSIYPIDLIGKANSESKTVTRVVFPDMPEQTRGIHVNSLGLRRMAADPKGQYVWIAASFTDAYLGRVDIDTNKVSMIEVPDGVQPYQIAVDGKGNVWFCSWMTDKIVRYTPSSGRYTFFELPTRGTEARHISVLDREGQPTMVVLVEGRLRKILTMTLNQ